MPLETSLIESGLRLQAISRQWRDLAPTPLQSPEWLLKWWNEFKTPSSRLQVLTISHRDGRVVGLAPFFARDSWSLGRSLRFLGSGKVCTDFQTILAAPGFEREVAEAVAAALQGDGQLVRWDYLQLDGVVDRCPMLATIMQSLCASGALVDQNHSLHTWSIDLTKGWDGFLATQSKKQQSNWRRMARKLEGDNAPRFGVATSAREVEHYFEACVELHQRRWTAVGQPGCFSDRRFKNFLSKAVDALATKQQLAIPYLEIDSRVVAAQIWLHDDHAAYMYQTGRDPNFDALQVGNMITLLAIRYFCEQGLQELDFLRGDEDYKARLKALPTPCANIRIVAPRVGPQLRQLGYAVGRELKRQSCLLRTSFSRNSRFSPQPPQRQSDAPDSKAVP